MFSSKVQSSSYYLIKRLKQNFKYHHVHLIMKIVYYGVRTPRFPGSRAASTLKETPARQTEKIPHPNRTYTKALQFAPSFSKRKVKARILKGRTTIRTSSPKNASMKTIKISLTRRVARVFINHTWGIRKLQPSRLLALSLRFSSSLACDSHGGHKVLIYNARKEARLRNACTYRINFRVCSRTCLQRDARTETLNIPSCCLFIKSFEEEETKKKEGKKNQRWWGVLTSHDSLVALELCWRPGLIRPEEDDWTLRCWSAVLSYFFVFYFKKDYHSFVRLAARAFLFFFSEAPAVAGERQRKRKKIRNWASGWTLEIVARISFAGSSSWRNPPSPTQPKPDLLQVFREVNRSRKRRRGKKAKRNSDGRVCFVDTHCRLLLLLMLYTRRPFCFYQRASLLFWGKNQAD